ncbi:MAG TPA: DUF6285 domain-containing protein [Planctomycetota bacterium]|nr:DUF6285 domain-containing protein [Planctomycetota bacterium]
MQDIPGLDDLLESARRCIEEELVPALEDPRLRFRARVAANVLGIALRERKLEPGLIALEVKRLEDLLGSPAPPDTDSRRLALALNDILVRRIRAGTIDATPGSPLWRHLRLTAVEKLLVANPAHLRRLGEVQ